MAMSAFAAAALAQQPAAAAAQGEQKPAAPEKKVKDQGEYDIFNEALKDQNGDQKKEVQDLDTWTQKYPDSDYKWDRIYMYMQAYSKMNPPQPEKVVDYGQQLMNQGLTKVFSGAQAPLNALDVLY